MIQVQAAVYPAQEAFRLSSEDNTWRKKVSEQQQRMKAYDVGLQTKRLLPSRLKWVNDGTASTDSAQPKLRWIGVRILLLDLPVLLLLLLNGCLQWIDHVHHTYLYPQLNAMAFTEERRQSEITYYARPCDERDLSTRGSSDLFLPANATPQEALDHNLRHGFTVFRNVLEEQVASELRSYISSRNYNLRDSEKIYVIENKNRFSFGLGTEVPIVAKAMKLIANHHQLRPAIEKIMGPDPALIEMTAITAKFGAIAQYYHEDVIAMASAMRYGRSFGPSYTMFMMLQNTTKEMGATGVCPGTLYCSEGKLMELCTRKGFPLIDPATGFWNAGDALLMNMNSFHRGSAHTDPDGPDRVMLVLTFSPKPQNRVESRLMSQGITFSLRWDMWGNTLNDLAHSEYMVWPWTVLRALGLYKLPGTSWGIDYVTGSSMRMSNQDYGFQPSDFKQFLHQGGFKWLPKFLHGVTEHDNEDNIWYVHVQATFVNVCTFLQKVTKYGIGAYLALFLVATTMFRDTHRPSFLIWAILRLGVMWLLALCVTYTAFKYVDESYWAKDIASNRRYSSVFENQTAFGIGTPGPTTFPTSMDILIENRYGSKHLAVYEEFTNGHPGNRVFRSHIQALAPLFQAYPFFLKNATIHSLSNRLHEDGRRILYQGAYGAWHWLKNDDDDEEAIMAHYNILLRELTTHSNACTAYLMKASRRIAAEYMYGFHRQTVLAQKYAFPYQRELEQRLLNVAVPEYDALSAISEKHGRQAAPLSRVMFTPSPCHMPRLPQVSRKRRCQRLRSPFPPTLSSPQTTVRRQSWIASGDVAEVYDDGSWYPAQVRAVSAHGEYTVWYEASHEEMMYNSPTLVRLFHAFEVQEEALRYTDDGHWYHECSIDKVNDDDGTYDITVHSDTGTYTVENVSPVRIRREDKEMIR